MQHVIIIDYKGDPKPIPEGREFWGKLVQVFADNGLEVTATADGPLDGAPISASEIAVQHPGGWTSHPMPPGWQESL